MTQYTGTAEQLRQRLDAEIESLFAMCYRVQQDNQHDQKQAEILQAEIIANQDKLPKLPILGITEPLEYGVSKYCIWPIWMNSTGTDAVECGRPAIGTTELCSKHQEE